MIVAVAVAVAASLFMVGAEDSIVIGDGALRAFVVGSIRLFGRCVWLCFRLCYKQVSLAIKRKL